MKFQKFMSKPFMVTACQVSEDNMDEVAAWCGGHVIRDAEEPFVLVPVIRPTHKKQTEATVGTWVLLSIQRDQRSFKVYTEEWLMKKFFEAPEGMTDDIPEELRPSLRTAPAQLPPRPIPVQPRSSPRGVTALFQSGYRKP